MNEYSKAKSFSLMLEPYCEYCGEFSPDVSRIETTTFEDCMHGNSRFITNIRCEHASRCDRIHEDIRRKQ